MEFSLHSIRFLARRLGVVVVTMFLWSTLLTMVPSTAQAAMSMHDSSMHQQMMNHPIDHSSPQTPANHHGNGACCLAGQHCTSSCLLPLQAVNGFPVAFAANVVPLPHHTMQVLTRPPQPPRRPPKA